MKWLETGECSPGPPAQNGSRQAWQAGLLNQIYDPAGSQAAPLSDPLIIFHVQVDSYNPMDRINVTLMQKIDMFGNRSACLGNSRVPEEIHIDSSIRCIGWRNSLWHAGTEAHRFQTGQLGCDCNCWLASSWCFQAFPRDTETMSEYLSTM